MAFYCHCHTESAAALLADEPEHGLKFASAPDFNTQWKVPYPEGTVLVNAASFGDGIMQAVDGLFNEPALVAMAKELRLPTLRRGLDPVKQGKAGRLAPLAAALRRRGAVDAAGRIDAFGAGFAALSPAVSKQDYQAFLLEHVEPGYEARLHYDDLLGNFGVDRETSDALRAELVGDETLVSGA